MGAWRVLAGGWLLEGHRAGQQRVQWEGLEAGQCQGFLKMLCTIACPVHRLAMTRIPSNHQAIYLGHTVVDIPAKSLQTSVPLSMRDLQN